MEGGRREGRKGKTGKRKRGHEWDAQQTRACMRFVRVYSCVFYSTFTFTFTFTECAVRARGLDSTGLDWLKTVIKIKVGEGRGKRETYAHLLLMQCLHFKTEEKRVEYMYKNDVKTCI